jgi:regulator of sigma E protease
MLGWLGAVLAPLVVFGLVVFVHELGHFLAAKAVGVYAPRFSIGFGPALWSRKWGETEYLIAAIPLGGYVRMASREDETMALLEGGAERPAPDTVGGSGVQVVDPSLSGERPRHYDPNGMAPFGPRPVPAERMFESKSLPARLLIMIAGVTMNALLCFVVLTGLELYYGRPVLRTRVIGGIREVASAPQLAQLAPGDTVVAVNGVPVSTWNDVLAGIDSGTGRTIRIRTQRREVAVPVGEGGIRREALENAVQPQLPAVIGRVEPSGPAARAGMQAGDSIVAVNGQPVRSWPEVVAWIERSPSRPITLDIARQGARRSVIVRPNSITRQDPVTGRDAVVGMILVERRATGEREPIGLGEAIAGGWSRTWALAGQVVEVVKGLLTGRVSVKTLSGPIGIAQQSVVAAMSGFERVIQLIAILSINVAVLNLLPIPILDGGQIVLNVVETVRGAAFSARTREYIARFGLLAIVLLLALGLFNDISSLFRHVFRI